MSDRTNKSLESLSLLVHKARHEAGRAIARAFPNPERNISSGSLDAHDVEDISARVIAEEQRSDTLRDPDTGAPLYLPVAFGFGETVQRAGGGHRQRMATRAKLIDPKEARRTKSARANQATALRNFGTQYVPPKELPPSAWESKQGVIGTEFQDDVPAVEASDEYTPFKARGLGLDHGRFQATARSTPVIWDSIVQQKNFLVGARWEWTLPDTVLELHDASLGRGPDADAAQALLASLGIDVDLLKRATEELNLEMALNPNLDVHQMRAEMCLQGYQTGFAVHEFGIDANAELGRRIAFIELRNASSVDGWITGPAQELVAISQEPPSSLLAGGFGSEIPIIDARKVMHFAVDREGANFEGVSRVRPAMFWRRLAAEFAKASMLHVQRFGRGIPVIRRPKEAKQDKTAIGATRNAAKNYYNSRHAFFDAPEGFDIEILQMQAQEGGLVQVLEYCDRQGRTAFGTGVFDLGRDGTGSFALANVTSQLVMQSLKGFARGPERAHQSLARAYVDAVFGPQRVYPVLKITGILSRSPQEAIAAWQGVINVERSADLSLEERNQLRADAGLPSVAADENSEVDDPTSPDDGGGETREPDTPEGSGDGDESEAGAETRSHSGSCRCRKCGGGKFATPPVVRAKKQVEVQCRGGSFLTHREIVAEEASVNFRALNGMIDDASGDGLDAIDDVAKETRRRFIELADPLIEAGDIAGIALLEVDTTAEVIDALRRFYRQFSSRVYDDMLEELRDLVGGEWDVDPQDSRGPGPEATIEAMATLVATNVVRQFNARLRAAAISVAQGGARTTLTRLMPSETFVGGEVRAGALTVMGETREYVATALGPKIKTVIYSAVMDANTCPECRSKDLNEYRVGSAAWERVRPPNRECEGELAGRAACRCIGIYVPEVTATDSESRAGSRRTPSRRGSAPKRPAPKAAATRARRTFARSRARARPVTAWGMTTTEQH